MSESFWTDDKTEKLKELHKEGFSHTQIAKAIGAKSRCAVAGKIFRLGLAEPARQKEASRGRKKTPGGAKFPVRAAVTPGDADREFWKAIEGSTPKTIIDGLEPQDCRWPLDGDPMTFCCLRATHGPYCRAHADMAFIPSSEPVSRYIRSLRRWAA